MEALGSRSAREPKADPDSQSGKTDQKGLSGNHVFDAQNQTDAKRARSRPGLDLVSRADPGRFAGQPQGLEQEQQQATESRSCYRREKHSALIRERSNSTVVESDQLAIGATGLDHRTEESGSPSEQGRGKPRQHPQAIRDFEDALSPHLERRRAMRITALVPWFRQ